ncbi:MAG: TetR family transcriptional regulator C-terminal domain-containing protein [Kordiimonadaceae bacterium]|nr:TetR family transcriptional regulator C-terminal domain-containing protein [Kordiimonadaceae bacterium]MBO6568670.1 TetR family transcriptional regulator C-terminal domain-containing protein [Kordiimonadaceae bacterium]MBO6965354.1 TetR family transcriptional regulator C-terminal domain-containing protein [Kordiimonadaceae bacterium]
MSEALADNMEDGGSSAAGQPVQAGASRKTEAKRRRHLPKAARRLQLINSTVDSIARRGFSDTTLSHVAKSAGLSQGIVNLHFDNKETLFVETLKHLRDEFRNGWLKRLQEADGDPVLEIRALAGVFFDRRIGSKRKLAGWFAFVGEAKSRPIYRQICEAYDTEYFDAMVNACQGLIDQGGYEGFTAKEAAGALEAMLEGLWLSMHLAPTEMDRDKAKSVRDVFLKQFFSKHF